MGKARILLVALALGQLTCNQAILTAPAGSSLTMIANPEIISSNGGVSVISVIVIEPAGTVVADGTVVQFFTNLGDIDEQGKTNDGVARVNLRANGRSGTATVQAISGGEGGGITPTPTPTPTPASGVVGVVAAASSIGPAASASDTKTVTIGNLAAKSVFVTADPPRITNSRSTHITANVFDEAGNPIAGVPVFFSVSDGAATNFMDSAGVPQFTDSNGQAFDVLRTRDAAPTPANTSATVVASVPVAGAPTTGGGSTVLSGTLVVPIVLN